MEQRLPSERRVEKEESKCSGIDGMGVWRLHAVMSINPALEGRRILLVDDDEDRRVLLTQFFKIFQTDLLTAASGKEGLHQIQQQSFDLIILDVMMDDLLGWDVFRQAKAADAAWDTPVLFLTSLGEEARETFEALDAGPQCRLESKGISTSELMKVAETMISSDSKTS